MATIQPEGENIRKAVKWISAERTHGPRTLQQLIEAAALKFNLSPMETMYLERTLKEDRV